MNKDKKSLQVMTLSAFALIGLFGAECMASDRDDCYKRCIQFNEVTIGGCELEGTPGRAFIQCVNRLNNCINYQEKCADKKM